MLGITLLGTGGMVPLKNRWLSSCLLFFNGHSVITDCGEGTQIAMKTAGLKFKSIDVICFTHIHADHISGLPGFLLTMSNEGRTDPVTVIGPKGIKNIVRSLCVIAPFLPFEIRFSEYTAGMTYYLENMRITPFRVKHSVPCLGYTFELLRRGKFDPEKAKENNVPLKVWSALQKNYTAELDGIVYTSDLVLGPDRKGLKVTYVTDTRPVPSIIENAAQSDLFICEGMFGEEEKLSHAIEKGHMLFSEAAGLALKADARRLWLTHYSPSLSDPEEYIENARSIFPAAECGTDGKFIELDFED